MQLTIFQKEKELYSADFEIINELNSERIGSLSYRNKKGMSELSGKWTGNIFDNVFSLLFDAKSVINSIREKGYRPCVIEINNSYMGQVVQRTEKTGFFTSFSYHQMDYKGHIYYMYPIGFGNEGIKNPVYSESTQIAQIEKDVKVIDDLHNFKIFSTSELASLISVLFSCYMYTVVFYKHGVKVSRSSEKNYSKTTNKVLLSKYNPNFKSDAFIV